jgi:probable HAF family extracellular repeat protein
VAGLYLDSNGFLRGFKHRKGVTVDVGTLGGNFTSANGINNSGQVAGSSATASGFPHAFLYQDGITTDLGTLGGDFSGGLAINNDGVVVGASSTFGNTEFHAFAYANGIMFDLGSLGGWSGAMGINEDGDVVGYSYPAPGNFVDLKPVLFRDGQVIDLSEYLPGWTGTFARSINDNGQIVGDGFLPSGDRHGFLLTPVP